VNSRPLGYFNNGDVTLLKMYCRASYDSERLSNEIDREGEVIRNQKGNPVVNPKILVRSINETRVLTLSSKLRVQPAARYDSGNDKKQAEKTRNAEGAARTIDHDEDSLLAGGMGRLN
jgi:phage terminase small subunit